MCCRQGGRAEHEVNPMANTDLGVTYTEVAFDVVSVSELTGSEDKAEIVDTKQSSCSFLPTCAPHVLLV